MNKSIIKREILILRTNVLTIGRRLFAKVYLTLLKENNTDKYVFLHIPKCGGTSVRKALSNWFEVFIRDTHFAINTKQFKYPKPIRGINRMHSNTCLTGHFNVPGGFLYQRYPEIFENYRFKIFTFIRDPLAHKLSQWNYLNYKRHYKFDKKFDEYLLGKTNYFARLLGCNESNYKEKIDQFSFVGITEELQTSMDILAIKLNKKKINIHHENISPKKETIVDNELKKRFEVIRALDYKIYNYCVEKFILEKKKYLKNETQSRNHWIWQDGPNQRKSN